MPGTEGERPEDRKADTGVEAGTPAPAIPVKEYLKDTLRAYRNGWGDAIEAVAKHLDNYWGPAYPPDVFPDDSTSPTGIAGATMRAMLPRIVQSIRELEPKK
jgi:hypothetical protein